MGTSFTGSRNAIGNTLGRLGITRAGFEIGRLRKKFLEAAPGSVVDYDGYRIRITDGKSFYVQIKDEFIHQIYRFEATTKAPVIIDGGSNIGVSILYFKRLYPAARIIGFEPDPEIFQILQENVSVNSLEGVELINAGLGSEARSARFVADHSAGGRVADDVGAIEVQIVPLSTSITGKVDFLKLNIEGEELPVLQELEDNGTLCLVQQLVLEYHGWPTGDQKLGAILELLDRNDFRYLIHDFDAETGSETKPPFNWHPGKTWFCLVYAENQAKR
jgi:FkbM family methyltransferase